MALPLSHAELQDVNKQYLAMMRTISEGVGIISKAFVDPTTSDNADESDNPAPWRPVDPEHTPHSPEELATSRYVQGLDEAMELYRWYFAQVLRAQSKRAKATRTRPAEAGDGVETSDISSDGFEDLTQEST